MVDDNSPDGTQEIVKNLIAEFGDKLHLLPRAGKAGFRDCLYCWFQLGLRKKIRVYFEMDADFSHNPEDLTRLREACAEKELI